MQRTSSMNFAAKAARVVGLVAAATVMGCNRQPETPPPGLPQVPPTNIQQNDPLTAPQPDGTSGLLQGGNPFEESTNAPSPADAALPIPSNRYATPSAAGLIVPSVDSSSPPESADRKTSDAVAPLRGSNSPETPPPGADETIEPSVELDIGKRNHDVEGRFGQ